MSKTLYAWLNDVIVGEFSDDGSRLTFSYSDEASMPLSLSLPLHGGWNDDAPRLFLEGLLPDLPEERSAMARALHVFPNDLLGLLSGVDATGGLRFTTRANRDESSGCDSVAVSIEAIADKVAGMSSRTACTWQNPDGSNRFALAGSQGKFAVARREDAWHWVDGDDPSTHIIKPDSARFPGISEVEAATMELARLCGIDTANHSLLRCGKAKAYIVERFDRKVEADGSVRRLHVEDLTQALGLSRDAKYAVSAGQVVGLLTSADASGSVCRQWLEQLVFNTLVGNCDAHAKNYSIFIGSDGVKLCPLYDSVCTLVWPETSDSLAMSINGKDSARTLTLSDWAAEAALDGVSQNWLMSTVARTIFRLRAKLPVAAEGLPSSLRERFEHAIIGNNEALLRELGVSSNQDAFRDAEQAEAVYACFPDGLKENQLLNSLIESIEPDEDGEVSRIHLAPETVLRSGQELRFCYIEAPSSSVAPDGTVTLPGKSVLDVFDEHAGFTFDTVSWDALCEASRDAVPKSRALSLRDVCADV